MANVDVPHAPVRIAVVDDDEDTRLWFKDILQSAEHFNLAGSFINAADALADIPRLQPDLTLMDIRLPDLNGIECTKRLRQVLPGLKIVMITGTHEQIWVDASLQAGVTAYLIKPICGDQLMVTLQFAIRNATTETPQKKLFLSPRENQVLEGLAEGLLYKEISQKLGISYAAVHKYQHNIFKKLRVTNRSEAIRVWLENRNR